MSGDLFPPRVMLVWAHLRRWSAPLVPYLGAFVLTLVLLGSGVSVVWATAVVVALSLSAAAWVSWRLRRQRLRLLVPVEAPPSRVLTDLSCTYGTLVVADLLALRRWSGARPPRPDTSDLVDPMLRASLNASRDLALDPSDPALGSALGLGPLPYLYDVPAHEVAGALSQLELRAARLGSGARLRLEPSRTPHLVRALRAAGAPGGVGASFPLDGLPSHALPLTDVRVSLGVSDAGPVVSLGEPLDVVAAEVVAEVSTPSRMVVFGDAAAFASWSGTRSRDGLADLVVWGEGASTAGALFGGVPSEEGGVVWADLPEAEAAELAERVDSWALEEGVLVAWDLRCHSDEYFLLRQVELDGSGVVSLPGGDVVGVMVDSFSLRVVALRDDTGRADAFRLLPGLE